MLFDYGPSSYVVSAVDVEIAAGSSVGPVEFRFPRPVFVTSLLLLPTTGLRADMAALRLRVQDESFADLIANGSGGHQASALALCGLTPLSGGPVAGDLIIARPYALQRPVAAGDSWWFTIHNVSGGPIRPELVIGFRDDAAKERAA